MCDEYKYKQSIGFSKALSTLIEQHRSCCGKKLARSACGSFIHLLNEKDHKKRNLT